MDKLSKLSLRNDILAQLQDPNNNKERVNVLKMLYRAVESLYSNGFYIYPNVINLFRINGFKKSSLFVDMIFNVIENISKEIICDLKWINHRSLRKSSNKDKNIVICFLLFLYHDAFIKYLEDFLSRQEPNGEKIKSLISSLKRAVMNVPRNNNKITQPLTNYNKNKSTIAKKQPKVQTIIKRPNPKQQKSVDKEIDDLYFLTNTRIPFNDQNLFNEDFELDSEFDYFPF